MNVVLGILRIQRKNTKIAIKLLNYLSEWLMSIFEDMFSLKYPYAAVKGGKDFQR